MPLIHVELKKNGVSVSQGCNQIEKYSKAGVFTGLFSLVQIFVAMEPKETVYFANPGPDGKFNKLLLDLEILGLIKVAWMTKDTRRIEAVVIKEEIDIVDEQNQEMMEKDYEASFPGFEK